MSLTRALRASATIGSVVPCLYASIGGDVDVDEAHVRVLERGPGRGGEVLVAGADADDQVRFGSDGVGRRRAGGADRAEGELVVPGQDADAGLGVAHRDAGQLGELREFLVGVGVEDAAAGDDQRALRGADGLGGAADVLVVGVGAADPPLALGQELLGHVEGLGLDVLRQRDGDGAGLGRVRQDAQAVVERGEQLLGPGDPVKELGQRPERVVDGDVVGVGLLELLQHRVRGAGGERVARQQQHRQPVGGGQRRAGEQVRGTRADRGADREGLAAAGVAGVADGLVRLGLFVAALVVRHDRRIELLVLLQGLADAGNVAVPEDAEHARNQALPEVLAADANRRCTAWTGIRRRPGRPSFCGFLMLLVPMGGYSDTSAVRAGCTGVL